VDYNKSYRGADGENKPSHRRRRAKVRTFGQRLVRLRKERGCTQVELAERLGIIQSLISDFERDRPHEPRHDRSARRAGDYHR